MFGKKNAGANTRRIQAIQQTAVNTIRRGILRRPNPDTKITENNNNHALTLRTCGNQQNDDGRKIIVVATNNTRNKTKM